MIRNVNYRKVDRQRKRPKVTKFVKSEVKRLNQGNLKRGLVVYEVLLLENDEYSDSLTEIEENIDREMADVVSTPTDDISNTLKKIIIAGKEDGRSELVQRCDAAKPKEKIGEMSFEIPEDLDTPYGWNQTVEDAFVSYEENAFEDRADRIKCKQELLAYLKYGEEPSHRIARAIVEDDDRYRVEAARIVLELDSDDEDEWWMDENLTIDDLRQRDHTENGSGLSQKQREERIQALQKALENDKSVSSDAEVAEVVEQIYGVQSDVTLNKYVSDIDLHWVDTINAKHTLILDIKQKDLIDKAKHGNKHKFSGGLADLFCVPEKLLESGDMRVEKAFVLADELQDRIGFEHPIMGKNQIVTDIQKDLQNQKELCKKIADEWDEDLAEEIRAEIRAEIGDEEL